MEKKNSSYKHQLLCKGPAGPECQVVEHGHVHFLPPGTATTNNWHHKQELEAFLEWLHGSYNLRYNFRKCMIFDTCGSWWQTTSKWLPIIWNFMVDIGSFTTFIHPKAAICFNFLPAKDARETRFRHPRLRRTSLWDPAYFRGVIWVVASMSSTSLHHPTNNQSSWSCCNKVSGMPLTNSTSFSWIPEWLPASHRQTSTPQKINDWKSRILGFEMLVFGGVGSFGKYAREKNLIFIQIFMVGHESLSGNYYTWWQFDIKLEYIYMARKVKQYTWEIYIQ